MPGMSEKFNSFGNEDEIKKVYEKKPDLEATNRDDDLEDSIAVDNLMKGKESLIVSRPESKNINYGEKIMLNEYGEKQKQVLTSLYAELSDLVTALKTENYPKDKLKGKAEEVVDLLSQCDTNLSIQAGHHYRERTTMDVEIPFQTNSAIAEGLNKVLAKDPEDFSPEDYASLDKLETVVYGAQMQFSKFLERQSQEN